MTALKNAATRRRRPRARSVARAAARKGVSPRASGAGRQRAPSSDEDRRSRERERHRAIFVTPGLRLSFDGAKDTGDGTFTVETSSGKRLAIRGRVTPGAGPRARRGPPRGRGAHGAQRAIGPDGRFALPRMSLLELADNTFRLTIEAPPNAPRKVHFSAICLDCGGPPPSAQQA